jgi:hypothetical protein
VLRVYTEQSTILRRLDRSGSDAEHLLVGCSVGTCAAWLRNPWKHRFIQLSAARVRPLARAAGGGPHNKREARHGQGVHDSVVVGPGGALRGVERLAIARPTLRTIGLERERVVSEMRVADSVGRNLKVPSI